MAIWASNRGHVGFSSRTLPAQAAGCLEVVPAVRTARDASALAPLALRAAPFAYCEVSAPPAPGAAAGPDTSHFFFLHRRQKGFGRGGSQAGLDSVRPPQPRARR